MLAGRAAERAGGVYETISESARHPRDGSPLRRSRAWTYEPATQTATVCVVWEETEPRGLVARRWEWTRAMHCVFRFEMEHLARRVGFEVEALYGDFYQAPLADSSTDMIWVLRKPQGEAA